MAISLLFYTDKNSITGRAIFLQAFFMLFKGLRHSADPFFGLLRLLGALMSGSWSFPGVEFGSLWGVLGPLGCVLGPLEGSWVTWGPS